VNNLSQTHLVPALPSTSSSSTLSLPFKFRHPNPVYILSLPHACHMPRPSHPSSFDHPNNVSFGWGMTPLNSVQC